MDIKIGFIGAGAVASILGTFFTKSGYEVLYISQNALSAKVLADRASGKAFTSYDSFLKEADMVFLTVPDDAITLVAGQLSEYSLDGLCVCHTSGVHSSKILLPLKKKGAFISSCHPAMPFCQGCDVRNAMFTVEGDTAAICQLLDDLSLNYTIISSDDKAIYHAALCIASNYAVTLAAAAFDLLNDMGMSDDQISAILFPLLEQNLKNMIFGGIKKSLTGPVSRGDTGTVEKHLEALGSRGEYGELYRDLLSHTAKLAMETGKIDKRNFHLFTELAGK